jgi:myxalamid-type polyketide synthase MxaE and MxaD
MRDDDLVADWLVERIAAILKVDAGSISYEAAFADLGLSSVQAVELSGELEQWAGLRLPPTLAYDCPTIDSAAEFVAGEARREGRPLPGRQGAEGAPR